jgi:hypothetical protein
MDKIENELPRRKQRGYLYRSYGSFAASGGKFTIRELKRTCEKDLATKFAMT